MTSVLPFAKMCAAGNDFVLLRAPDAARAGRGPARLARALCDRRRGIGADGLLIVETGRSVPRLFYFNADGSRAFCGNGTRCAAVWLHRRGLTGGKKSFILRTAAGNVSAEVRNAGKAAVRMPDPKGLELGLALRAGAWSGTGHRVDTGVPHLVVPVRDLEAMDVQGLGRALRTHPAFKPGGVNVDFVRFGPRGIAMRTYERGVEDETLACGTGAVAAAIVAAALGLAAPPVRVAVRGGAVLKASFHQAPGSASDVWLEGPADIVFTGEFPL
ncbi:MAG: diaminopimelate epimerase [Elusimicrobiota bacterium]|jgi:diaminopimelate epimerase